MKNLQPRNRKDMEIVETQRRHGQEWKAPYLPGDPPHYFPPIDIPSNPNWVCSEWMYSRNVHPSLASWHSECSMWDHVRKRTWRNQTGNIIFIGRPAFQPPHILESIDEGKDDITEDEGKQCPVCMENLKAVSGKCGHLLCFSCSKKIRQDFSNCPTCRESWIPTVRVYL